MTYTIYFTFEKGKRRNQELKLKTREDCLSVIDNMGKHTNYASFCLITDGRIWYCPLSDVIKKTD